MCFGNMATTKQLSSTTTPPDWLTNAAVGNLDYAKQAQGAGFQAYDQPQVAGFSPQQQSSFGMGRDLASSVNGGQIGTLATNYANAGPGSVNANPIYSNMSPYMNEYVSKALAPQLNAQNQEFAGQNKSFDSAATGAGAFGDTGWNLGRTNLATNQDIARTGLIGNAYNAAFNTAIGAGAQDSASQLNAQTTNANLRETALQRQLGGANFLYGAGSGVTSLNNSLGGQQTAQQQAELNARYSEFMRQQYQDPQFRSQLMNSAIGAGRAGAPITKNETTSAPDNSGYGMIGSGLGSLGPNIMSLGSSLGGAASGAAGWVGSGAAGASEALGGESALAGAGMLMALAKGGPIKAGQTAIVNEKGTEAFVPDKGRPELIPGKGPQVVTPTRPGTVIPHEVLAAAMAKRAKGGKMMPVPPARAGAPGGLERQLGIAA